jgi:glyoxylase-like metal-dependent hydrolase (beta-lactamase superfamily II)
MTSQSEITYDVFISDPIPQAIATLLPNGDHQMWSPMSSTLIYGPTEAVLIDPPITIKQTEALADWVERFGKKLSSIYITHGHGDHWFGTRPLTERFPGVSVYATEGTLEVMRQNASDGVPGEFWTTRFPDQIADASILAKTVPADGFSVDGAKIVVVEVGHSDGDNSTVLHVPSIGLVVAGDVVYTNVHQYLVESSGGGLDAWLHALDIVEALNPTRVVSGHKDKTRNDDPSNIAATRKYLNNAKGLLAANPTQLQFFSQMMKLYPERLNPSILWISAQALLRDE